MVTPADAACVSGGAASTGRNVLLAEAAAGSYLVVPDRMDEIRATSWRGADTPASPYYRHAHVPAHLQAHGTHAGGDPEGDQGSKPAPSK